MRIEPSSLGRNRLRSMTYLRTICVSGGNVPLYMDHLTQLGLAGIVQEESSANHG